MRWRGFSYVKVIAVDDYSSLIRDFGTSCFRDEQSLLLPVFPDNDSTTCIRSLYFIHQWLKNQPVNIPCLAWGDNGVVSNKGIPFIPWKLTAEQFCFYIDKFINGWRCKKNIRANHKVSFLERQLSPREKSIFIYTKEGKNIAWISNTLGISSKTVWTHRRRAMDKLGVKRLHQFINIPRSLISENIQL